MPYLILYLMTAACSGIIYFTFRRNFLYMLDRDPRQLQQVRHPRYRPAVRLLHKRILRPKVRPPRPQLPPFALAGLVIDPPLSPRPPVVNDLEAPASPWMEGMRDRDETFAC